MTIALAGRPGPLVTFRRLVTALRLLALGREAVAASRHEPPPDASLPHLCSVDWLPADGPPHRKRRQAGYGDAAQEAGWR